MGIALPEAGAATAGRRARALGWPVRRDGLLLCFGYLAASVALNWRLWAGFGTMAPIGDPGPGDQDIFAWSMRYAADALAHGHLPALVTTVLNAPHGINLMWNTTILFPATVLAPVTLLRGPQASLTIMITLGYAGSAAAMYWLLRRYGASVLAGGLGGAVFGFSPGLLVSADGHYHFQFVVLLPLITEAVLRIVTGQGYLLGGKRGSLLAGAWLGLLIAAQIFTGEEMLTDTIMACLVLVAVLAVSRPRAIAARLGATATGLGACAVTALLADGYALWVQFRGPLAEHGSPFPNLDFRNSAGAFVNPPAGLLFHTTSSAAYANAHGVLHGEYVAYLGWPLLVLVPLITVWYWRDLRIRAAGVTWAALELLSLGGHSALLPFHWLQGLPLLVEMLPDRLSLVAIGAAAAVLAFGLDLARSPAPGAAGPRTAATRTAATRTAALARGTVPVAVAVLAVLPLVPRPVAAVPATPLPTGWGTVFTRLDLPPEAIVLVVPAPDHGLSAAMRWQADTGQPARLVAGWFIGPNSRGRAVTMPWGPPVTRRAVLCLDALWSGTRGPAASGTACAAVLRPALAWWHPAAVVADTRPGTPVARLLVTVLGKPTTMDGDLLGWRR
jgi:hypothetical protein